MQEPEVVRRGLPDAIVLALPYLVGAISLRFERDGFIHVTPRHLKILFEWEREVARCTKEEGEKFLTRFDHLSAAGGAAGGAEVKQAWEAWEAGLWEAEKRGDGKMTAARESFPSIDHGRVVAACWAEYAKTLREAAMRGDAKQLLTYDANETLGDAYPGFHTRVGGRVDLDVTSALKTVLPFGPEDAPWVPLVKHLLGVDKVRSIKSVYGRYGFGCVVSAPGDLDQNWHQDGDTTRDPNAQTNTVIVFTQSLPVLDDMGKLQVIPGSHRVRNVPGHELPPELEAKTENLREWPSMRTSFSPNVSPDDGEPGDVLVMDYRRVLYTGPHTTASAW